MKIPGSTSGSVATLEHIRNLLPLGNDGVVVGKTVLDSGAFTLRDSLSAAAAVTSGLDI